MSRAVLSSPALMTEMFRAQTLMPTRGVDAAFLRELTADPAPLLGTGEAIAQYAGLSDWWLSTAGSRL
jgi:hypothetical protein